MTKDWIIAIFIALAFTVISVKWHNQKVVVKPLHPDPRQATIMQFNGYDYQLAWWLHGAHSLEEMMVNYQIPKPILRQVVRRAICEGYGK